MSNFCALLLLIIMWLLASSKGNKLASFSSNTVNRIKFHLTKSYIFQDLRFSSEFIFTIFLIHLRHFGHTPSIYCYYNPTRFCLSYVQYNWENIVFGLKIQPVCKVTLLQSTTKPPIVFDFGSMWISSLFISVWCWHILNFLNIVHITESIPDFYWTRRIPVKRMISNLGVSCMK